MSEKSKILICMGTSGIAAGAEDVANNFIDGLKKHKLSDKFDVVKVGDRGLFRDVLVDIIVPGEERVIYEYVTPEDVDEIIEKHLVNGEVVKRRKAGDDYKQFFATQKRIVLAKCGEIDPEKINEYISHGGYEALKKALTMDREQVISDVEKAGLRGRGGAGFSTGKKWRFAYNEKSDKKYMVCNADEGDPGAFMDRSILEGDPQAVLEGMLIGAYAVGADECYIYCRAEYPLAIKRLRLAIQQAEERNFLGKNILGTDFSCYIKIKEGAGAFVCGEETALMASIEGYRGMPRSRPPFPAQKGLWGKPTNINNVETYANVPHIFSKGHEWFSSIGTETSKGTKVFALAGKIKNTGLVEVPMGTTIKELLEGPGGGLPNKRVPLKGVQLGGPSGGCIPAEMIDIPIDYESITKTGAIMGSGGMVVMDAMSCMVDIAKFFLKFTVDESCGQCVPCRVGLKRMHEVLEKISDGEGTMDDIAFLEDMGHTIRDTAFCGLGNTAPNPVLTTLKYYRDEYFEHINNKNCPAHVCVPLVKFVVNEEKCVKCGACFKACPVGAVEWEKGKHAFINLDKCIKCKSCIMACSFMAIE